MSTSQTTSLRRISSAEPLIEIIIADSSASTVPVMSPSSINEQPAVDVDGRVILGFLSALTKKDEILAELKLSRSEVELAVENLRALMRGE
jgi:hypothetical protein